MSELTKHSWFSLPLRLRSWAFSATRRLAVGLTFLNCSMTTLSTKRIVVNCQFFVVLWWCSCIHMTSALKSPAFWCIQRCGGHAGNNAVEMQTTATFDQANDEFIISTPTTLAQKYWITNSAVHAKFAVVFAQLIIGSEHHGIHGFLVRIRNEVRTTPKFSSSSVDWQWYTGWILALFSHWENRYSIADLPLRQQSLYFLLSAAYRLFKADQSQDVKVHEEEAVLAPQLLLSHAWAEYCAGHDYRARCENRGHGPQNGLQWSRQRQTLVWWWVCFILYSGLLGIIQFL